MKAEAEPSAALERESPRPQTAAERRRQINRANRFARYEHIVGLSRQGLSERLIAQQLHVSRQLVHRFVTAGAFPERAASSHQQSILDPYLPHLRQRWEQGCHNALQLAREIQAQGFRGSASLVGQHLSNWRVGLPEPLKRERVKKRRPVPLVTRHLSAQQASWLFITPREHLTADQQELLGRICHATPELQELYELGQDFALMVKQRNPSGSTLGSHERSRALPWNCEDLLPASNAIRQPSRPPCLLHGAKGRSKVRRFGAYEILLTEEKGCEQ